MRERRAAFLLWREEKAGRREASRSGSSASELPMTASAWTDDRIGRLKTLWLAGQTAEQIALDLANGITRSAVLGKVHRMGLSAGRPGRPPKRPGTGPKPPRLAPTGSLAARPIDARPEPRLSMAWSQSSRCVAASAVGLSVSPEPLTSVCAVSRSRAEPFVPCMPPSPIGRRRTLPAPSIGWRG